MWRNILKIVLCYVQTAVSFGCIISTWDMWKFWLIFSVFHMLTFSWYIWNDLNCFIFLIVWLIHKFKWRENMPSNTSFQAPDSEMELHRFETHRGYQFFSEGSAAYLHEAFSNWVWYLKHSSSSMKKNETKRIWYK